MSALLHDQRRLSGYWSVVVLLQLAATATGYHLPQLVHTSCHLHAARARRGHPVLSSPEEKQGRSPLDGVGGAFKGGIEDAVKRVTGELPAVTLTRAVCHLHDVTTLTSVPYVTRTGNKEYQFGDFTKSAVEGTKVGVEDAVKKVTGNEEYQCNTGSNLKLAARGVKP